jgi:CubicO group peptidase (beta-lactamase class C family)
LSQGVWLSDNGPERYALKFEHTGGLLSGTMHQFQQGKQVVQWGFAGTRKGAHDLELSWGRNNILTATVDLARGEIRARVVPAEGVVYDALFRRTSVGEVPGFAAQQELPYRLRPPEPGSGWEVAGPEDVDIGPRHLEATVRAVTRGEAGLLHSLVVARRGKLVVEEYFHGYRREDLHEMQSATKGIASLLVGIARDRGEIRSLDEPVLTWFPEYAGGAEAGWERVTIRHLLTMTAGLHGNRGEAPEGDRTGPALFADAFGRRPVHEAGTRWVYNSYDVELLGGILHRATGMQADEFAARFLFAPLGITEWDWELGKMEGYPSLAGTLHLRPLDMTKIGQLVLDKGRWQGKRVVSEEWIEESTAPLVATNREVQKYGYLWIRLGAPLEAGPYPVIVAEGWGSQIIHVVPALDAVVVNTGGNHLNTIRIAPGPLPGLSATAPSLCGRGATAGEAQLAVGSREYSLP